MTYECGQLSRGTPCRARTGHSANKESFGNARRRWNLQWAGFAILLLLLGDPSAKLVEAQSFTLLHSFSGSDGSEPGYGALVMDSAGNLYGNTTVGGIPADGCFGNGCGVTFKLDPSGNETVLHFFAKGAGDGWFPDGGLVRDASGNLYGTSTYGGSCNGGSGCGTVFKIDSSGIESVLYSFEFTVNGGGGLNPISLFRDQSGTFYGVTVNGGTAYPNYHGTVFKLDTSNGETVFHNFIGSDGSGPYGSLITDASGNLYGTTTAGGASSGCSGYGCGTVFRLDPDGNETVLHSFAGPDGAYPVGGLVMDSAGNLYGTTEAGGSANFGTIFKIDTSGSQTVLHSFSGQSDGGYPFGALITDEAGNFYGTTEQGGSMTACAGYGCGVVFKIDAVGNESVIHSFMQADGAFPSSTLLMDTARNLYGTTLGGGSANEGTVFKLALATPSSAFSAKLAITAGTSPGFALKARLTQGTGAPAIDPVTQSLMLQVGTYSVTIPAGSFVAKKNGSYVYAGTVNGVALQVRILEIDPISYQVQVTALGVDLTSLAAPIPVTLSLGYNTGTSM